MNADSDLQYLPLPKKYVKWSEPCLFLDDTIEKLKPFGNLSLVIRVVK